MIVKERQMPIYLRQLEALFRRLPAHHPKRDMIVESLAKHKAGYKGEQAINYPLSFLSEEKYRILHDIRLFDQNYHFQIDRHLPHWELLNPVAWSQACICGVPGGVNEIVDHVVRLEVLCSLEGCKEGVLCRQAQNRDIKPLCPVRSCSCM